LAQLPDAVPVLPPPGRDREHLLDDGDTPVVAELPVELDALPRQLHRELVVAGQIGGTPGHPQRVGAELERNVPRAVQEAPDPLQALSRRRRVPEVLELHRELQPESRVLLLRPVERPAQILPLGQDHAYVGLSVLRAEPAHAGEREHPLGMTPAQTVFGN
jgi:hypothetical protein